MNEANKHLEDSIKEAKKNRKRKCCILMIVIIAAIVLVSLIPFIYRVCLCERRISWIGFGFASIGVSLCFSCCFRVFLIGFMVSCWIHGFMLDSWFHTAFMVSYWIHGFILDSWFHIGFMVSYCLHAFNTASGNAVNRNGEFFPIHIFVLV